MLIIYINFAELEYMPTPCQVSSRSLVLLEKIFEGVYHTWAWRPSRSCDLDRLYKLSFPLLKEAPHEIWR